MLIRNVLGWRNCSSLTYCRHGLRWYSSERSTPVSEPEFQESLSSLLNWEKLFPLAREDVQARQLGFAISGGVDSMALAALYFQARTLNKDLPEPHGLIIDHKVRPESTEEAKWVSAQLDSKFGMKSTILPLTWSKESSNTQRFESDARALRYRALGQACRQRGIDYLMVAHHGDDQAETIMMRLANNRLRSGLQGISRSTGIPECEGIYGLSSSGQSVFKDPFPFPLERGGIQILRPLLEFEKARLIATCENMGIEWAEDRTNQIPTLTTRNAIRHVYNNHKVPEALSPKALVRLASNMQKRVEARQAVARRVLNKCYLKLDVQTGALYVRFPPSSMLLDRPIETESDRNEAMDNAYCLIERVADFVAPMEKFVAGQLHLMIEHIYPELEGLDDKSKSKINPSKGLPCAGHVWWRPYNNQPREWILSRQPPEMRARALNRFIVPPFKPSPPIETSETTHGDEDIHLFDGRFWIRLENYLEHDSLLLRTFDMHDMQHLPTLADMQNQPRRSMPVNRPHIKNVLGLVHPGEILLPTLPAVFRVDATTGKETLVGFPTLNVSMIEGEEGRTQVGPPPETCDWEVHYKKVSFGSGQQARNVVVPGLTEEELRSWTSVRVATPKRKNWGWLTWTEAGEGKGDKEWNWGKRRERDVDGRSRRERWSERDEERREMLQGWGKTVPTRGGRGR